jgi:hypothetical protein
VVGPERVAELRKVHSRVEDFEEALHAISEAAGPFDRDPITHAHNTLRAMQRLAVDVLRKHGITPRREDDVLDGEPIPG